MHKVIASTDKSLQLPGIPQSFIQRIVDNQQIPEMVKEKELSRYDSILGLF